MKGSTSSARTAGPRRTVPGGRWGRAAAAALVVALALGGCGRDAGGGAADEAGTVSEGKAKGEVNVWAMGTEGEKLGEFAKDFMKDNPDATVKVTPVPWDAAHQKIANAVAAKETPDVSLMGTTWMGEFARTGALDPTPTNLVDKSAFFPGAWDTTVVDGTSYGVPWYVETRLIFYRKDLAAKAGVTKPPATWDELKALAQAYQRQAGAKWGIHLHSGGAGSWQTFMPFAWQNGAELVSGKDLTLDTPQLTEALSYYQSYYAEGLAPKDLPDGALESMFINGQIGAFVSGPWHIGLLNEQGGQGFGDKYGVAHMPKGKAGATSFVGGGDLAVFKDAKNRDAAWKFVAWLSKPETQAKWYQTVNDLPAVKKAWDDPALKADPLLATFGKQLEDAKSPPAIATWEQIAATIDGEVEKVCKAGAKPADAAKAMQDKAKTIGTGA